MPTVYRNSEKSQDIAMPSLILPGVPRQTSRLRQKTATNNDQMPSLPDIIPNTRRRYVTVNNLPTSFHLNRLVDVLALKDGSAQSQKCGNCDDNNTATCYCFVCQNFLCKDCFESHQRLKATRGHRNIFIDKLRTQDVEELINRPVMCSQQYHENQPLEFYCEECKVPICHKCSVVSHNRHTITDAQKAAQVQKMQMAEAVKKVKAETVKYENEIEKQIELMEKNKNEILSAEKKMTEAVEEIIRDLREHERKIKANLTEIYEAQRKHSRNTNGKL